MTKPRVRTKLIMPAPPLLTVLKELVLPAFEEEALASRSTPSYQLITPEAEEETAPGVQGCLRDHHLVNIVAFGIDPIHTCLRFSLYGGYMIGDYPSDVLLMGNLLDPTPFHIRSDSELALHGRLTICCDLVVRVDDAPLVSRRLGEPSSTSTCSDMRRPFPRALHCLPMAAARYSRSASPRPGRWPTPKSCYRTARTARCAGG